MTIFLLTIKVSTKEGEPRVSVRYAGLIAGISIFVVLLLVNLSFGQISAGSEGVVLQFEATTGKTFSQGFYTKAPWQTVKIMDIRIRAYSTPAEAASQDLQDVNTTVTLNYKLDPLKVVDVVRTLGDSYAATIIVPAVQESVKAITAKYNAADLIGQRETVRNGIVTTLSTRLQQHGIIVDALSITDFKFSPAFSQAVEQKVAAVQQADQAQNKLRQVQIEAQQAAAQAEGQKNAAIQLAEGSKQAAILNAEGLAQATLTLAKAQSDANRLLSNSLTPALIQYTQIQKLSPDVRLIVAPNGANLLINTNDLFSTPTAGK
ncbi:MAG: prohibitin family protein [Dehalococcoidia bacterium]|nr:prohibitin family protein [Dehalococcoidia bacterium]